ncbi:hypothetical protein KCP69_15460 [Salmonella enterica subsp. enterica]|nr:hypothetical protein KCP69_15460 [Salmonella enterica subsp. enterica]
MALGFNHNIRLREMRAQQRDGGSNSPCFTQFVLSGQSQRPQRSRTPTQNRLLPIGDTIMTYASP